MPNIRRLIGAGVLGGQISYLLRDDFNDTRAAGSVNGTYSTDGKYVRNVVDTNGKMSVNGSALHCLTGNAVEDGLYYSPVIARRRGQAILCRFMMTNGNHDIGWDNDTTSVVRHGWSGVANGASYFRDSSTVVGTLVAGVTYTVASVLRDAGSFLFIKGGIYTNWTMLAFGAAYSDASMYARIRHGSTLCAIDYDFFRVPLRTIALTPLVSDSFTRADGVLGNTDGVAMPEAGGGGIAWVAGVGTWAIATNRASCSALSGGVGIAVAESGNANVVLQSVIVRTSGNPGIVARYTDANNYIRAVLTGTNLQVIEVVGGTPNTLVNAAVTYSASAYTVLILDGNQLRATYSGTLVGSQVTTAVTTGTKHGLFTDDITARWQSPFTCWARGTSGEWNANFDRYTNP